VFRIEIQGHNFAFDCGPDNNVLLASRAAGGRILPLGCRGGGCGVCRVRILSGSAQLKPMSRAHVSVQEEGQGYALACRVYPLSDICMEPAAAKARAVKLDPKPIAERK